MDIYDVVNGEIAPRRVWNFLHYAPSKGAFKAAVRGGDEYFEWDEDTYLAAATVDTLRFHSHDFQLVNSSKEGRKRLKAPDPLPIPGRKKPKKKEASNGFAAMLAAEKAYQEKKSKA